jgi:hypothetical protein
MSEPVSRRDRLFYALVPVMNNYYEWREHPERYVAGYDMDKIMEEYKRGYGVTPEEWADLEKRYDEYNVEL